MLWVHSRPTSTRKNTINIRTRRKRKTPRPGLDCSKKVILLPATSTRLNVVLAPHVPADVGSDSIRSECSANLDISLSSFQRVLLALDTLKSQHTALLKALQAPQVEGVTSTHVSPPPITEEEEHTVAPHSPSISFKPSKRTSIATTITDSLNEWFDAPDGFNEGAQEFVLDVHAFPDGTEQPSRMLSNDSRSSLDHGEDSSVDTDIAQEPGSTRLPSEEVTQPDASTYALQIVRRTCLPAPPVGDEGSLFSMLKKNVGKVRVPIRSVRCSADSFLPGSLNDSFSCNLQ